jgi:folate-dependent phosphoribosylglycinamide formyltransferase PurN
MEEKKVRTVLIASGGGTDADSIMRVWEKGCIPEAEIVALISTKNGAKCLERATVYNVKSFVVDYADYKKQIDIGEYRRCFEGAVANYLDKLKAELVFLVGCIHRIPTIDGADMYNIHPADIHKHGGEEMYGLKVHEHVLKEIEDAILRGKKKDSDAFFTYPTIHRAVEEYDAGDILLQGAVKIPAEIIKGFMDPVGSMDGELSLKEAAEALQKVVLPYEWIMLPAAVRMAARRILERKGG